MCSLPHRSTPTCDWNTNHYPLYRCMLVWYTWAACIDQTIWMGFTVVVPGWHSLFLVSLWYQGPVTRPRQRYMGRSVHWSKILSGSWISYTQDSQEFTIEYLIIWARTTKGKNWCGNQLLIYMRFKLITKITNGNHGWIRSRKQVTVNRRPIYTFQCLDI